MSNMDTPRNVPLSSSSTRPESSLAVEPTARRCEPLDDHCLRLIRYKAAQLVGKAGFRESDREDLEQQLTLDLLSRMRKFDPARSSLHTFADRVINHAVATLLAARQIAARDFRRIGPSLNEEIEAAGGCRVPRAENVAEEDSFAMRTRVFRSDREAAEMTIDLASVTAGMPDHLQLLCELLKSKTLSQISEITGRPRSSIQRDMAAIGRTLRAAGLEEYLQKM